MLWDKSLQALHYHQPQTDHEVVFGALDIVPAEKFQLQVVEGDPAFGRDAEVGLV